MIYKWVRDLVEKFTFVTRTELSGGMIYIYYNKNGKEKRKKIPLRANKTRLLNTIEKIKEDINYYENRAKILKKALKKQDPGAFAFSGDWNGEEYERRKKSESKISPLSNSGRKSRRGKSTGNSIK